jgi:hypothetical protein
MWKHDIVILQGTTMILPYDENSAPPEEQSRFDKVELLLMGLSESNHFDQILIMDADTLIYDFSFDVTRLLSEDYMLVAQRTHEDDPPATRNINNGITLWNLYHPLTEVVARDWDNACREGMPDNRPFRGDQYYLRQVLKEEDRESAVSAVWDEFYYRDATAIKHFQRSNSRSWNDTGLDSCKEKIQNATRQVCNRFSIDIAKLDDVNYTAKDGLEHAPTTSLHESNSKIDSLLVTPNVLHSDDDNNSTNCTKKRKSIWDLYP